MELDETDRHLLALLQNDCSGTLRTLADAVGVSAPTCLRRVRRLTASGVIRAQAALVDARKMGYGVSAFVEVRLEKTSGAELTRFERRMSRLKQVQMCCEISGEVDYILLVIAHDLDAFSSFAREHLGEDNNVAGYQSHLIMRFAKNDHRVPA